MSQSGPLLGTSAVRVSAWSDDGRALVGASPGPHPDRVDSDDPGLYETLGTMRAPTKQDPVHC